MRKNSDTPESKASRAFRRSLSSLLPRSSSRSPERARHNIFMPHNESKISFVSAQSTFQSGREPVRPEEFADSDSSHGSFHTDEEAKAAESIYSIIQEYDPARQSFWFNEEFDHSADSNDTSFVQETEPSEPHISHTTPEETQSTNAQRPHESRRGDELTFHEAETRKGNPFFRGIRPFPVGTFQHRATGSLPEPDVSPMPESNATFPTLDTSLRTPMGTSRRTSSQVLDSVEERASTRSREGNVSLSSGELLSRLDGGTHRSGHSSAGNSVSSELALQSLIAGEDLDTDLPVMVYSVHEKSSSLKRRAANNNQPNLQQSLPLSSSQIQAPILPQAVPIQIKDGTSLARRISVLTETGEASGQNLSPRSVATAENVMTSRSLAALSGAQGAGQRHPSSARHSANRSSNSSFGSASYLLASLSTSSGSTPSGTSGGANTSTPGVFSDLSEPILEDEPAAGDSAPSGNMGFRGNTTVASSSGAKAPKRKTDYVTDEHTGSFLASPAPSITRDSIKRHHYHENMFYDEEKYAGGFEQPSKSLSMPWYKWIFMMVSALVAVPVFFLLPLGVFDHGGFSRALDHHHTIDEKSAATNWRFQRRYTRTQKIASLVLGIIWVAVILAMTAVGFGVGLSRANN